LTRLLVRVDMSVDVIALKKDGTATIVQRRASHNPGELKVRFFCFCFVASRATCSPQLCDLQLVAVSDNIAELTRVTELYVRLFLVVVLLL